MHYLTDPLGKTTDLSLLVSTITTCFLIMYLLFAVTNVITKWTSGDVRLKTIIENRLTTSDVSVQNIQLSQQTVAVHINKKFIWKGILIGYALSLAIYMLWLAPLLFGFYILYQALKLFVKLTARSFQS